MGATTRLTMISGGATAGKPPRQSLQRLRPPVVKARIASGRPFREEPALLSTLRPGPKSKTPPNPPRSYGKAPELESLKARAKEPTPLKSLGKYNTALNGS